MQKNAVKYERSVKFLSTRFVSMYTLTPVIQYLTSKIQYTDILTLIYNLPFSFKGGFCHF